MVNIIFALASAAPSRAPSLSFPFSPILPLFLGPLFSCIVLHAQFPLPFGFHLTSVALVTCFACRHALVLHFNCTYLGLSTPFPLPLPPRASLGILVGHFVAVLSKMSAKLPTEYVAQPPLPISLPFGHISYTA